MFRKFMITLAVVLILAIATVGGFFLTNPGISWPFRSSRSELRLVLGMDDVSWLERAEVVPWAPDLNYKPFKYFAAASMSVEEFKAWARSLKLTVYHTPAIPGGAMALPDGIRLKYWIQTTPKLSVEAEGTLARAIVWARWSDGRAYVVVAPIYD